MPSAATQGLHKPSSPRDLFVSFSLLALQGFGGVLAIVQRELVERKQWLTREEFLEDWAVAQILPGPNVVNLALMIGSRHFGMRGAMAALLGLFAAPLCLLLLVVLAYHGVADRPMAQGALRGMGAVAAGLIAATGIKLVAALHNNPMGHLACGLFAGLTFLAVGLLRLPLLWVLLSLGVAACLWAYRCIGPASASKNIAP